jgi:hypothetical protein
MDRKFSSGRNEKCRKFLSESVKGMGHLEDLDVGGRALLN